MAQWYYNFNGSMQGPCAQKEVQKLITAGVLTPRDLVYREGEEGWREIRTFGELDLRQSPELQQQGFGDLPRPQWDIGEGQWLLLVRKQDQRGTEFVQMGPYSIEEVRTKVARREVLPSDHVWRKGMNRWLRLGWIPEFDRREAQKKRRLRTRASVAALAGGAIFLLLFWDSRMNVKSSAVTETKLPPPISVVQPPPKATEAEPPSEEAEESEERVYKKTAERVPRMALEYEEEGLLLLKANDAISRKVIVELSGAAGSILAAGSFYRRFELVRKGARHPIDLKKMGVPRGKITVSIRADEKQIGKTIFFGDRRTFRGDLTQRLKDSSYSLQIEKEELLGRLSRHLKLLDELQSAGKMSSAWKHRWNQEDSGRLRGFSARSRNRYFFPELWDEFKKVRQEIDRELVSVPGAVRPERMTWAGGLVRGLLEQAQSRSLWKEITSLSL